MVENGGIRVREADPMPRLVTFSPVQHAASDVERVRIPSKAPAALLILKTASASTLGIRTRSLELAVVERVPGLKRRPLRGGERNIANPEAHA
jgi:hypothetical protein